MDVADLLPPDVRARLRALRLAPRGAAGGDGVGLHTSRSRGAGLEFAQYRGYEPGDEPRRIDWKLYARSDRYFVREAERDSPLTVWIVIDATASMTQADTDQPGNSKLRAACALAAGTIEIALRQGDRFGLITISGDGAILVPAAAGARQRDRCLIELSGLRCAGAWPAEASLRAALERIGQRSFVLLLSDFFDTATADLSLRLARTRFDVSSVQIVTCEERDFPFTGGHRLVDPETGTQQRVDARAVRNDFLQRFGAAQVELARQFAGAGIRHTTFVTDEAVDAPLQRLFARSAAEISGRDAGAT